MVSHLTYQHKQITAASVFQSRNAVPCQALSVYLGNLQQVQKIALVFDPKPTSTPSLVTEEAALWALGIHVCPVRQEEGQIGHTTFHQPPQVLSHKLVSLL